MLTDSIPGHVTFCGLLNDMSVIDPFKNQFQTAEKSVARNFKKPIKAGVDLLCPKGNMQLTFNSSIELLYLCKLTVFQGFTNSQPSYYFVVDPVYKIATRDFSQMVRL